jgi:hypothetical protein
MIDSPFVVPLEEDLTALARQPSPDERIRAQQRSRGQLWMLEGGPGLSGIGLVSTTEQFIVKGLPDLDVYMPDHRGTGRSHFID